MANFNQNTQNWCSCCDKGKAKSSFIQSLNENHNKYLPYCKTCINAKLRQYKDETGSDGAALYCVCAELGYPMIREVYDIAIKLYAEKQESLSNSNIFTFYHNTLRDMGIIVKGFWQSDMDLSEFIEFGKEDKPEKLFDVKKLERSWGKFEPDDYELLESFYEMYTKNIPEMDTAMELRYRDLCKAELRKRKADESGDITEITKAEESLRKNMGLLKLDNFDGGKKSDMDRFIDRLIWQIEETEPSELEDKKKYSDIRGFEQSFKEIMRSMRNLIAGSRDYPDVPKEEE